MKKSIHGRNEVRKVYAERGLDAYFPQLKPYLFSGARVLDIGCGPGTITMDVAQNVQPGEVLGIDPEKDSIAQANQLSTDRGINNVEFRVGSALELDLESKEFDVVYAHAVFGWFPQAKEALAEMSRVTRKTGWLIITLGDEGPLTRYPPCPAYEIVRSVRHECWTDPDDPEHYYDGQIGRRAVELFREAKLNKISIKSNKPHELQTRDSEPFDIWYDLAWLEHDGRLKEFYAKIFSLGKLDEKIVIEARNELERWAIHPDATLIPRMGLVAAGQV